MISNLTELYLMDVLEKDKQFWFYEDSTCLFPELTIGVYNNLTINNLVGQTKVEINITHKAINNKSALRYWALAYVTYQGQPFMILRNLLDNRDPFSLKYVVDNSLYAEAMEYINSFKVEETVAGAPNQYLNDMVINRWGSINTTVLTAMDHAAHEDPLVGINFTLSLPTVGPFND